MAQAPVFGRRPGSAPVQPPRPAGASELSREAAAFAAEVRSSPRGHDGELAEWKQAHRRRMWRAAGPWKYWACILGALSLAGRLHDFGPASAVAFTALRGLAGVCSAMALWRGLRRSRG
jgi:hypothetical protein